MLHKVILHSRVVKFFVKYSCSLCIPSDLILWVSFQLVRLDARGSTNPVLFLFLKVLVFTLTSKGGHYKDTMAELNSLKGPNLYPRRKPVNPSQWGVAAPCSSEQFKSDDNKHKPLAKQWHRKCSISYETLVNIHSYYLDYLSIESANRVRSSLKHVVKHLQDPHVISLGGGIPSADFIPFDEITFRPFSPISSGSQEKKTLSTVKTTLHATKYDITEGTSVYDLTTALNYGQGCGSAQFLRWVTEHTEMVHSPPYADWQCSMTIGNTSALDMCLHMLAQQGDCVLTEKYTFSTAIEMTKPLGLNFIGLEMDHEGILPESLSEVLNNWNPELRGNARKPFLLYTIPTGQNPTGTTQSFQRRQAIYQVAREHDLLILEDDPYYFLQMNEYTSSNGDHTETSTRSLEDLFVNLTPSYLRIDTDGRVIRMDSFSKVISPGARLGWITACQQIIERFQCHTDVSTQSPSGLSQLAFFKLLDDYWGHAGYVKWLIHLRNEYTKRRNVLIGACEKLLPRDVISWEPTRAGMFVSKVPRRSTLQSLIVKHTAVV